MNTNRKSLFVFVTIFIAISVSSHIFACNKKGKITSPENPGSLPPPPQCKGKINFSPESVSGWSPLPVTFTAELQDAPSEGITAVGFDFNKADGIIDFLEVLTPATNKFVYQVTYTTVGEFVEGISFYWNEGNISCGQYFTSKISVVFRCPTPTVRVIAQQGFGLSYTVFFRILDLPIDSVSFKAGPGTSLSDVTCTPYQAIQNSCYISINFPDYGDFILCWYAESYCGARTDLECLSLLLQYSSSQILSYGGGTPDKAFFSPSQNMIALRTPPYITLLNKNGEIIRRLQSASGMIYSMKFKEGSVWILEPSGNYIQFFSVDLSGKIKTVIGNIFGAIDFDVFSSLGKKYGAFVRSFADNGDILVFDITDLEATTPICRKDIPPGAREIKVINNFAFVRYSTEIHAYKINLTGSICTVADPITLAFGHVPSFFDIEGDSQQATGVFSTSFQPEQDKIFQFSFDFTSEKFSSSISKFVVFPSSEVQALKVSPFNVSHVAIGYFQKNSGEYKVKLFDLSGQQTVGGEEGFSLPSRPVSISFVDTITTIVFDDSSNIARISFYPLSQKNYLKLGGARSGDVRAIHQIDCNTGNILEYIIDGSSIALLDLTPVFSSGGTLPVSITHIPSDPLLIHHSGEELYGIFRDSSGVFLSNATFSFRINFEGQDIRSFAKGITHFLAGGSSGLYYAKKTFSNFLLYERNIQVRKIRFISPNFFIIAPEGLYVVQEGQNLTEPVRYSLPCQDIAISDDSRYIYCLTPIDITEYELSGILTKRKERTFALSIGNIVDSDYEQGHIFFVSKTAIGPLYGTISSRDLKIKILSLLGGDRDDPISISAHSVCLPQRLMFLIYGNFGTEIMKGFATLIQ